MNIDNITVLSVETGGMDNVRVDGVRHVKALPYLSLAQTTCGYYSFGLDGTPAVDLQPGGFFVAPAFAQQEIIHHVDPKTGTMSARWLALEVTVNERIPLDTLFSFPAIPDLATCLLLQEATERLFRAEHIIDRKIAAYELVRVLLAVAQEKQHSHPAVERAIDYMHRCFRQPVTVAAVAVAAGLSPSRLYALFQRELATSPMAYLAGLRLSHACSLLEGSDLPVSAVAEACGIPDAFYFSRQFRHQYGLSPTQYRRQQQENRGKTEGTSHFFTVR